MNVEDQVNKILGIEEYSILDKIHDEIKNISEGKGEKRKKESSF